MRPAFHIVLLALAGCAATPQEHRNDKEQPLPPGQGAFGSAFTWEWRKKDPPAPGSTAPAATPPAAPAQPGAKPPGNAATERQEFEEWRAWQEWKRKNAK